MRFGFDDIVVSLHFTFICPILISCMYIYCVQTSMDGFKRKLTSKFTAIKTQADTHTHVCTPMACALTQTALPKLIYTPSARSILNATQEEYNQTTAWVNQLFANATLDASETGKTFETLGN